MTEQAKEFVGEDLSGARFRKVHLNGAQFRLVDLSGVTMRDVSLAGAALEGEIDGLRVNGVEVEPLIEAELTRRNPGRAWRTATGPDGLRDAWAALERSWAAIGQRAAAVPAEALDVSVQGEWSFVQTLRHLVFVTDAWLGAIRGESQPFHPWGLPFTDLPEFTGRPVQALGIDPDARPSYPEVVELRADRVARVRQFLAELTPEGMGAEVEGPVWAEGQRSSVHRCLRVIFNEECEHLRFAERDLDVVSELPPARPAT